MTSINKTAYPQFKRYYTDKELRAVFRPTKAEVDFVLSNSKGDRQRLTLLSFLKSYQYLGHSPDMKALPKSIKTYLSLQLGLSEETELTEPSSSNKKSFYRYRQLIRQYLKIQMWSDEGITIVEQVVNKAAKTMSSPTDLINVAIEKLIEQRYELPAFSTLSRLVNHIRQEVHTRLYNEVYDSMDELDYDLLDSMLIVQEETGRLTAFSRLNKVPGKPTITTMRNWVRRLSWLEQLFDTSMIKEIISDTKIRQFAAEVQYAEAQDLLDMNPAKRYTHLICLIYKQQVNTKDELVELFLRRIRSTKIGAEKKLVALQALCRTIEEQMLSLFSKVVGYTNKVPQDSKLGNNVRSLIQDNGGSEHLSKQYEKVSAYHDNNYFPLLWDVYKSKRSAMLDLVTLLDIQSGTEDQMVAQALDFILVNRHKRTEFLSYDIDLDFMSDKWLNFVQIKQDGVLFLKRKEVEIAVLFHVADALRCADMYVVDSEKYADYRQQLLSWEVCEGMLEGYCKKVGIPASAAEFINHLKKMLSEAAQEADDAYPDNSQFFIDDNGQPHLKRQKATPLPEGLDRFERLIEKKMPQRELLDILKRVHCWIPYTRHFGPASGTTEKLTNPVYKYIFTLFGYGCNLGANQTARHTTGLLSSRVLRRINKQHIDGIKLDAAIKDIIGDYSQWDLPSFWGDGSTMIVDGTHIELIENNLLGAMHIRYGSYGGIAYKYICDNYIALFTRFISCGAWEAIYILDGFMANQSILQPNTVVGDTHSQSEPVFALAHLMGIQLMPRMRNWSEVKFYRPTSGTTFQHIDSLFSDVADFERIETHWKDIMQVALSVHVGKIIPSILLRRLGVKSKKNKLYQAFRALGQVVRTTFLLKYISNPNMQRHIQAATTKVESFNNFSDWITFGGSKLKTGDPVEMEKRVKYADLIANIVMLHNVVDLTKTLNEMNTDGEKVTKALIERLSPYMTKFLLRFGRFYLDMNDVPEPLKARTLNFV